MFDRGPIGLGLAQAFARLGMRVRLMESSPKSLPREDEELTEMLARRLAAEGVELMLGTTVTGRAEPGAAFISKRIVKTELDCR